MALRTSASATVDGVVTKTAPVTGTSWISESCTSPGTRRKIDDQIVQLAPQDAAQELLHHAVQHRPAPDHGLVARIEQAHRNHLQPLRLDGKNFPFAKRLRLLFGPQHDRHVGAVHVRIEQADRGAQTLKREGQVHGYRGLSHAALSARDGDEVFYALDGQFGRLGHGGRRHGQFLLDRQNLRLRILPPSF